MDESSENQPAIDLAELGHEYVMLSKIFKRLQSIEDAITILKRHAEIRRLFDQWTTDTRNQVRTTNSTHMEQLCHWVPKFQLWDRRFYKAVLGSPLIDELEKRLGNSQIQSWAQKQKLIHKDSVDLVQQELKLVGHYDLLVGGAEVTYKDKTIPLRSLQAIIEGPVRNNRRTALHTYWNWFEENGPELDETYQSLLAIRTDLAHNLGWKSVSEFMYARYERTSYHAGEIGHFRNALREILSPILEDISNRQHQLLSLDTLQPWDVGAYHPQGNPLPVETKGWLWNRAQEIFPKVSSRFDSFFQSTHLDVQIAPDAHPSIESHGKLSDTHLHITMNTEGTMGDITSLSNLMVEMLVQRVAQNSPYGVHISPDRAHILKKIMAILCLPHIEFLFPDEAEQFRLTYLLRELKTLNQRLMQDHFEQLVYSKPNATAGERNGMWNRVETLYDPKINWGNLECPAEGGAWQAQARLFTHPFSGIGEALAIPYGFQFFRFQQENPHRAQTRFEYLCDESFGPKSAQSLLDIKSFQPLDIKVIETLILDTKRQAFSMMT